MFGRMTTDQLGRDDADVDGHAVNDLMVGRVRCDRGRRQTEQRK